MFVVGAHGQSCGYQIENLGWWFSKCLVSGPPKLLTVLRTSKSFCLCGLYWSIFTTKLIRNIFKNWKALKLMWQDTIFLNLIFTWNLKFYHGQQIQSDVFLEMTGFIHLQVTCQSILEIKVVFPERRVWFSYSLIANVFCFSGEKALCVPPILSHRIFKRHTQGCAFNKVNRFPRFIDAVLKRNWLYFCECVATRNSVTLAVVRCRFLIWRRDVIG